MWRPRSTSRRPAAAPLVALLWFAALCARTGAARAQVCCAGGSAVTPGRLEPHEDALVGLQARASGVLGSFDPGGAYLASPGQDREYDLEQDLFAAVRVLPRAQLAVLAPLVETFRSTPLDGSHFGGGFGDVNLSARYDLLLAGQSRYVPGVAVLAGITAPTGTAPEAATQPLAVDATGVGALQGNAAIALEQTFGPWLANATVIVAERAPRSGETLGTQWTLLAAGAYTFSNDAAAVLAASYAFEGDATRGGRSVALSSKAVTTITLSALWPLADWWRLLGGLVLNPPLDGLGKNQPAAAGLTITVIRSWS
ncbi:MAG TPA: hypothetical protein VE987_22080 [Polyangiaceae bacterium]|nr:hypothetical protein [Polyangiaceae bacterium]